MTIREAFEKMNPVRNDSAQLEKVINEIMDQTGIPAWMAWGVLEEFDSYDEETKNSPICE